MNRQKYLFFFALQQKKSYFCGFMGKVRLTICCLFLVVLASCSEYAKVFKGKDQNAKLAMAKALFDKKDFTRSLTLYEQIETYFSGTEEADQIAFRLGYCHLEEKNYELAAFLFRVYTETYPNSPNIEEAYYLSAFCKARSCYSWELDQTNTYKALEELQQFINLYPFSKHIPEINESMDKLRNRLSEKVYHNAKLYYEIMEYKAAISALKNAIKEYPDMPQREELEYLLVASHFYLAKNSAEFILRNEKWVNLKKERYQETLAVGQLFLDQNPQSSYKGKVESFMRISHKKVNSLPNQPKQ